MKIATITSVSIWLIFSSASSAGAAEQIDKAVTATPAEAPAVAAPAAEISFPGSIQNLEFFPAKRNSAMEKSAEPQRGQDEYITVDPCALNRNLPVCQ